MNNLARIVFALSLISCIVFRNSEPLRLLALGSFLIIITKLPLP
jgi:hypothetical protein